MARNGPSNRVEEHFKTVVKRMAKLFADSPSIKHIRDVATRMPKARQRYLLAKFTSMKKLKVFLDVAENARQQVKPLAHQLYAHLDEHVHCTASCIEFEPEVWPFLAQRIHQVTCGATKLYVEGEHELEQIRAYLKYVVFASAKCAVAYESICRHNPALVVANQLKTDLRIMFDTGRYYDTIVIPSDGTSDMVIPLSIPRNEIGTIHPVATNHKVHRLILASASPFFRKLFARRRHCAGSSDQITLIVLDSTIIASSLLPAVLRFVYTGEINSLPDSSSTSTGDEQSSSTLPAPLRHILRLYEISRFIQMDGLGQACENRLADGLNGDTIVPLMKWAESPNGSSYVSRLCHAFIRTHFVQVSKLGVLNALSTEEMIRLFQDDFLDATELDIMRCAIRWAEHCSREKEPDLVRRKKKEPPPDLIRNALAPLVPYIRLEYVLPINDAHLSKICQSGIIDVPTSIDPNVTTIGKGWEYGNQRLPRYNQEIVQIFRDLNDGEWVEEAYNAIETIPRSMEHVPEENNNNHQQHQHHQDELESDNDHLVIVNSLIIPNEQVTAAMLKRLHQLQTHHQPTIPRHLHFLRVAVLREFGLPESLIPIIRDPCQYYQASKIIKKQFGIVQGFRYYRKLRDSSSPSVSVRLHQPDLVVVPPIHSPPLSNHHHQAQIHPKLNQSTPRRILDQSKRFLLSRKGTSSSNSAKPNSNIDYVPVAKGSYDKNATLEFVLPDVAPQNSGGGAAPSSSSKSGTTTTTTTVHHHHGIGIDNAVYHDSSAESDQI